ncbi:MAG TPA: TerC family protein, partial [Microbacteriaceae bacterium]|nr:TerC family protein [Microbacteriaceae bacterium]
MDINPWFEWGSLALITLILVIDVVIAFKRPHIPSTRESALWIAFYVTLALIFAGVLFVIGDAEHGGQFIAGWLTEYSLSVDNLFV